MTSDLILDILFLFFLGSCGWALFALFRLPVPALLGTIAVIGTLRAAQFPLPDAPVFLYPLVQVMLGLFIGSKVTRETVLELKEMIAPAFIIVTWALAVVFLLGSFLARITNLDPYTAILSSSMGGLPEMTVIALATNANIAVIIVMQTFRMLVTVIAFPLIVNYLLNDNKNNKQNKHIKHCLQGNNKIRNNNDSTGSFYFRFNPDSLFLKIHQIICRYRKTISLFFKNADQLTSSIAWGVLSLGIASGGGFLFLSLGVPAGAMVGSTIFIVAASLAGINVISPAPKLFGFILMGVGVMVADNINAATVEFLISGSLIGPIFYLTLLIFLSSLCVAFLIHKLVGWDFPTSFLAAAPGGFTVMTSLAIKFGMNPFRISMLHLCRLLAIKIVVPFVFMFLF